MLEDATDIHHVVLACETVDLRKGIDGLAMIIGENSVPLVHEVFRFTGIYNHS